MARLATLVGMMLAFASGACAGAIAQAPATGSLAGSVTDASGNAVAGAAVIVTGSKTYTAVTDSHGTFSIDAVPPGTYGIRVSKGGYQPASESGLVVAPGGPTPVAISLLPVTLQTIAYVKSAGGGPHFNTTPAAVNVVTSQAFENQAQTQVTQVLNQVPGVQISFPGGSANGAAPGSVSVPTIRGAASYETASLIDGHPLAVASYGDYITSYLSSFMFGTVEVVKGPGSDALEVNNAINGTINFRTKDPTAQPVPDYEVGFTTNGGSYANLGLTDSALDGRLGYVFDVAVIDEPSALNGKRFLIDPSNGYLPTGKQLSGTATYTNVGNTASNIQTGYSLVACCYTLYGDFNNVSELLKLRYRISPSVVATVSYLDGQTFTDQNDNVGNLTQNSQFLPGSGYSGSLRPGAQQIMYLYPGSGNNLVNNEPIFQAEVSSALGNDTILARYYHATLYRETQQGTTPEDLNPLDLTLYGSSSGIAKPFDGVTTPVAFQDYFNESELDKLGGWSFEYNHPFGENTISFSIDQNTTQATSYEIYPTFTSVTVPQGSSQLFTTLQLHANLQLAPTVTAMLADYQNVYRSTYATTCPYSGSFSNCAIDGSGVTFATTTTAHNDPRFGFVWQPHSNLAVRFAGGSAIAPPYLDLLSQPTAPFASYNSQTKQATLVKNSGQLLPETAFGYDLGADYRFKDSWTVLSGDVYENNLFNHYFGESQYSGLTCGQVSYPCIGYGSSKAPPGTPIFYTLNTNISNFRFQGIEMQLQRIPPVGWGFTLAGALQRGYVYNLPAYFYCSNPGPHCQYNQNLNIIANQNLNGEGVGGVSYAPYFGFDSTIGSLNTRIPYAQGNVAVSYTFHNHAFLMLGTTYYGNNNSLNEPPFGYGYFTARYPFTPSLSLQISGNNIWNAWPGVLPVYGSGVAIPLANNWTAATQGNVLGPATWTLVLSKGFAP
ncbi:MAG: TonB-dependent receptor [Candidatus Eremiobacteraeota bacterium]|nr:TonB-dependent receptor [Candidatus Eremiobacteraeota bacterium]